MRGICSVEGCSKSHHSRGFCGKHYAQWYYKKDGKLKAELTPRSNKGIYKIPDRVETKEGYITVRVNGKHIYEHRIIMEKELGRKLETYESVHHINGIRNDNRPENLELWVGPIRYGQRATDIKCHSCGESYKIK
jgi:hypothetical protein